MGSNTCPKCRSDRWVARRGCDACGDVVECSPRPVAWQTVLVAWDPSSLLLTKSLLAGAGIEFRTQGEPLQALFGPLVFSVEIQVAAEDSDDARALLTGLDRPWPRSV